jgi:hypothetical protein
MSLPIYSHRPIATPRFDLRAGLMAAMASAARVMALGSDVFMRYFPH